MTFSIVINNYNYGRFLRQAIESCLAQTYQEVETVVVDDGSTDESRAILAAYSDRIVPILKENGGQASAYIAGFAACTGDFVLFLDSDDVLHPDAVSRFIDRLQEGGAVKVQSRLRLIDVEGEALGVEEPAGPLPSGDFKAKVLRYGPSAYPSTPSSACAYTRSFLAQVFPMPEAGYRVAADSYLKNIAPLFGAVLSIQEPVVDYRLHGSNTSHWGWRDDPRGRLLRDSAHYELACEAIARWATHLGTPCEATRWIEGRWQHLARKQILFRLGGDSSLQVPLRLTMRAALDGSLAKRVFVLGAVLFIYLAPAKFACQFVIWLFRKKKIGEGLPVTHRSPASPPAPLVPAGSATS